jgi:hypothetical protein
MNGVLASLTTVAIAQRSAAQVEIPCKKIAEGASWDIESRCRRFTTSYFDLLAAISFRKI